MPRWTLLLFCSLTACVSAQETELESTTEPEQAIQQVQPQLVEESFFTDRIASLWIDFDQQVASPEDWPSQSDGFRIVDIEVLATQTQPAGRHAKYQP